MISSAVIKLRLLSVFFVVIALILIGRLYHLQIVKGEFYRERSDHQYASADETLFDRGQIFFTTKSGDLLAAATLKTTYFVYANPSVIKDANSVYRRLSGFINLPEDVFLAKVSNPNDVYEEIIHGLSEEEAQSIFSLKIKGIGVARERSRYYPGGSLSAHVLGFVAYKGDQLVGRYGLEQYYEDVLRRRGGAADKNFFTEIFGDVGKILSKQQSFEGDLITSIEPTVANQLEIILKNYSESWRPDITGGIIMNPQDGRIYALSVYPTFDLNNFKKSPDPKIFSNPLVESVYEMGSIMKPLTMAVGIDTGVVSASSTYRDDGFLILNGRRISNFDGRGRGVVSMQEVLNQSLNTGAAFVSFQIGRERFADYFKRFGFGVETGIDLPNETHGLINNLDSQRDLEIATASFGQGIAVTPVGIIKALAALGNGGYLVTPHLVDKINYGFGLAKTKIYDRGEQVFKKETSEEITRMLVKVVDEALAYGKYKMANLSVAAKTGTAQIAKLDGGGYYDDRYLHSFFGYFPAYNPKFLIFLYAVNPKGARYSSETWTAPFFELVKFLLNYYEVPPDR
jgi:cell division protein FtsI/penicillin-binding protein 2